MATLKTEYVDFNNVDHIYFEEEGLEHLIGISQRDINMIESRMAKIIALSSAHNKEIDKTGPTTKTDKMDMRLCDLVQEWNDLIDKIYDRIDMEDQLYSKHKKEFLKQTA